MNWRALLSQEYLRANVRHAARHQCQCLGQFGLGEVDPEAVVDAAAEAKHGRRTITSDVESVRIGVDGRIAVGRRRVGSHSRAGRDRHPTEFDVFDRDSHCAEDDG